MNHKKRVVVAEDDRPMAMLLNVTLQRIGLDVSVAHDGEAAWRALRETETNLVITDCRMPVMSGQELCERMRCHPSYQHTPIILLTAKAFELDGEFVQRLRLTAVLPKPFSPRELSGLVSRELVLGGC